MKLSILQENLAAALAIAKAAAATKTHVPILTHVRIEAAGEQVTFTGTNLDLAIVCKVDAVVEQGGAFTVPAKLFADYVADLPTERVDLELDTLRQQLHLTCGGISADFKGIAAREYPTLPQISQMTLVATLTGGQLAEAIAQVAFAASTDDKRPVLNGVLVQAAPGAGLTLVATDGFRLARRQLEVPVTKAVTLIVPASALRELAKLLGDDDEVKMVWSEEKNMAAFSCAGVELTTRLLEPPYPDYEPIIPKELATTAQMDTQALVTALHLAEPFARESGGLVKVELRGGDKGGAVVSAQGSSSGAGATPVAAKVTGADVITALGVSYATEALRAVKAQVVEIGYSGAKAALTIRPQGRSDYLELVMPMAVNAPVKVVSAAEVKVQADPTAAVEEKSDAAPTNI